MEETTNEQEVQQTKQQSSQSMNLGS